LGPEPTIDDGFIVVSVADEGFGLMSRNTNCSRFCCDGGVGKQAIGNGCFTDSVVADQGFVQPVESMTPPLSF
jgi:hypothetical protein